MDHPENFADDDIKIGRNLLYHNGKLKTDGRNYFTNSTEFSGLKAACGECRKNTNDHLGNHLTLHFQCKHCLFELKSVEDEYYWKKVCRICGKKFSTEALKTRLLQRHDFPRQECNLRNKSFSSKFNFHRHMVDQHDVMARSSQNLSFDYDICSKFFTSRGNLGRYQTSGAGGTRLPHAIPHCL